MAGPKPGRQIQLVAVETGWAGRFQAMGSPCEVITDGGDKWQAELVSSLVASEAWRIEDKFSRYLEGNIIYRINNSVGQPIEVDAETANLLDFAVTLYEISEGCFDITSGVLRGAWKFDGGDNIPGQERINVILERVGWDQVSWDSPVLTLMPGMEVDLGGIGKEYAVDQCARRAGEAADIPAMVNFGGDLAVTGPPRTRDTWKVGVEGESPGAPDQLIDLRQGALATSGDARRFLLKDGIRYSHILDPRSGWPVPDAPASITVAADSCTQAGMLCTLAMLRGKRAEDFLEEQGLPYWCRR